MSEEINFSRLSEEEFAGYIEHLPKECAREEKLINLLREDHIAYANRGTAEVSRMRSWILFKLSQLDEGLPRKALLFVLEELDTSIHAYTVAMAARVLRSLPQPEQSFAPFLLSGLKNIRYHDEPVAFNDYAEFPDSSEASSAVDELLETLNWMGQHTKEIKIELKKINGLRKSQQHKLQKIISTIPSTDRHTTECCCKLPDGVNNLLTWGRGSRLSSQPIEKTLFEDQNGDSVTFNDFFLGKPSIVAFFYTRCDNPQKCSLTVTKLAQIQTLLAKQGLEDKIRTAALSYDPEYDNANRLARYGNDRKFLTSQNHRLLRTAEGFDSLKRHFNLGVNFAGSLVNRHRIELYILDSQGDIAASFERIRLEETEVVDHAVNILEEEANQPSSNVTASDRRTTPASQVLAPLAAAGVALFPKCPLCWIAYMSMFGIAGLERIPYIPQLLPLLIFLMAANILCLWLRSRATGRKTGLYLVCAGAISVILAQTHWPFLAIPGIILTLSGSLLSTVWRSRSSYFQSRDKPERDLIKSSAS